LTNQLTSNKDKILQMFEEVKFLPAHTLLEEKTLLQNAYIIISGNC